MEELVKTKRAPERYSIVDNKIIEDERLDWDARMVVIWMLHLPKDWVFYKSEVQKHGKAGRDKFHRIWMELQRAGYLTKERVKDENGRFAKRIDEKGNEYGIIWTLHEEPISVEPEVEDNSDDSVKNDSFVEAIMEIAPKYFKDEFSEIDELDLDDSDKEIIKQEFGTEMLDMLDVEDISLNFTQAWDYTMEHCVNDDYFAQYLVNNMLRRAKLLKFEKTKKRLQDKRLNGLPPIPIDYWKKQENENENN